jgi:hypothetical protein
MRTVTLSDGTTRTRLETWGEIALHLGVEVRTAQRWERRMGIPIRRLDGGQAVFAFVDELDAWLDKKQLPPLMSQDPPRASLELTPESAPVGSAPIAPAPVTPPVEPVPIRTFASVAEPPSRSRALLWTAAVAVVGGLLLVAATLIPEVSNSASGDAAPGPAVSDEFNIIKMNPPTGTVAFGGNVEPEWGVYVTLQYSLRSREEAWLCMIAEVDPVARSGSVCADPVHMVRGTGTAQTRVIVTNTTANGPVLTRNMRLIVAEKKVCPTVPGNYRSHDASCFPNPFYERFVAAEFAWTHPGAGNAVGVIAASTETEGTVGPGREVKLTVSYLLQDASRGRICVRPVLAAPAERGQRPSGLLATCSNTEITKGFGTTEVSFMVPRGAVMPSITSGLWLEIQGLSGRYMSWPLRWDQPSSGR